MSISVSTSKQEVQATVVGDVVSAAVSTIIVSASAAGGSGATGASGVVSVSAPITNSGTQSAAVIGLAVGTGLSVSSGSLAVSYGSSSASACVGNDTRLSDAREWSAATVSQAEAEAGSSTTRRAFTALRVFQAIAAWWSGSAAKTKLDGIAAGATANQSDAHLLSRTNHTGTQAISTVDGLQSALDQKQAAGSYAASVHTHTSSSITDFAAAVVAAAPPTTNASLLTSGTLDVARLPGSVVLTADSRLSDARTPVAHVHAIGDVTGLQAALDGKQAAGSYASATHTHVAADITDFTSAVVAAAPPTVDASLLTQGTLSASRLPTSGVSAGTYTSVTVDTYGRVTAGGTHTVSWDDVTSKPSTFSPSSHTHDDRYYTETEVDTLLSAKQASGSYATLVDGTVPAAQLPSYVDDILEYADQAAFPATGETGKIYVAKDTNKAYRWGGSAYIEISPSPGSTDAVAEGSVNLYHTTARAAAAAPVQSVAGRTGAVTLAKADVGLGNVDNTSDANKPISTATQTALDGKAATSHTHSATAITSGTLSISRIPTGTTQFTVCIGNDARLSDARAPTAHTHAWSDITTGLPTTISGYGITDAVSSSDSRLTDARAPTAHTHTLSDIDPEASASSVLLLNFDGSDGSTSTSDASASAHTVTFHGSAEISTDQSKWGGSSLYLDGSSWLSIPYDADFDLGGGDFTIEAWWWPAAGYGDNPSLPRGFVAGGGYPGGWAAYQFSGGSPGGTDFAANTGGWSGQTVGPTMTAEEWHHVAFVRRSGTLYLYVDGVETGSIPSYLGTLTSGSGDFVIGADRTSSPTYLFHGYIDDLRLVKNFAVYKGAFTPPSGPLTADASIANLILATNATGDVVAAPTIPASAVSGLATVATTNSYDDLDDLPSAYSLPTASDEVLGGVKIGSGVTITDGVISVSTDYAASSHTHALADISDAGTAAASDASDFALAVDFDQALKTNSDVGFGTIKVGQDAARLRSISGPEVLYIETWNGTSYQQRFAFSATAISFPDNTYQETAWTGSVTWSNVASKPTTLSGYGITDAVGSSDSRLTDARTPTAHKTSHATGGSDALAPSDIGAQKAITSGTAAPTGGSDGDIYLQYA